MGYFMHLEWDNGKIVYVDGKAYSHKVKSLKRDLIKAKLRKFLFWKSEREIETLKEMIDKKRFLTKKEVEEIFANLPEEIRPNAEDILPITKENAEALREHLSWFF